MKLASLIDVLTRIHNDKGNLDVLCDSTVTPILDVVVNPCCCCGKNKPRACGHPDWVALEPAPDDTRNETVTLRIPVPQETN